MSSDEEELELDAHCDRPPHVLLTAENPTPTEVIYDETYTPILVSPHDDVDHVVPLPPVVEVSTYVEIKESFGYGEHDHVVKEDGATTSTLPVMVNRECNVPNCDGQGAVQAPLTASVSSLVKNMAVVDSTVYTNYDLAPVAHVPALPAIDELEVLDTTALQEEETEGIRPPHFYIDVDYECDRQLSTGKVSTTDDHILNTLAEESRTSLSRLFDPLKRSSSEGGQIWKRLNIWVGSKIGVKNASNDAVNPHRGTPSRRASVTSGSGTGHKGVPITTPMGVLVPRTKRFLTKGTAGFMNPRACTSAINLRPAREQLLNDTRAGHCLECPHCRKFVRMGVGRPLPVNGQCPCSICIIIGQKRPSPLKKHSKHTAPSQMGVFCPQCSQLNIDEHAKACERWNTPNIVVDSSCSSRSSVAAFDSRSLVQPGRGGPAFKTQISCMSQISTVSAPFCRICHMTDDPSDLINPCRCTGTLKYVHEQCLLHWLQICHAKYRKLACCEICLHKYNRRRVPRGGKWRFPKMPLKEKLYHAMSVLSVVVMCVCAAVIVICFTLEEHDPATRGSVDLEFTPLNIVTLLAAGLFFSGFAGAMAGQSRANASLYRVCRRIYWANYEWRIESFTPIIKEKDPMEKTPSRVSSDRSFNRYIHEDNDSVSLDTDMFNV